MGITFTCFKINQFPDRPRAKGGHLFRKGGAELYGTTATTKAVLEDPKYCNRYERYTVFHEAKRKMRGRLYDGIEFAEFYHPSEFPALVHREENRLICATSKKIARSFVDLLNRDHEHQFNLDYLRFDFETIKPRLQQIQGLWVSNMGQPFLNVMGLFGHRVDQSDMFKYAEKLGSLSSMLFVYSHKDEVYPAILSADGSITFSRDEVEQFYIELVESMLGDVLQGAVLVEQSRQNKRRNRNNTGSNGQL